MKKLKLMSLMLFVSIFGASMYITGCSDGYIGNEDGLYDLESRGGNNGKNGKKGMQNGNYGKSNMDLCTCIRDEYPVEDLSDIERSSLEKMREEEKLARDVYIKLYEKWDLKVFDNISNAEQRHMDAILCLMDKYDIEDPAGDNPIGIFTDSNLQVLFDNLVNQGSESIKAALQVGATIEDLDIFDLIELSKSVDNKDILAVFNDLTKGSRNHMRAFYGQLLINDSDYTPQYIDKELFDSIIHSDRERGGTICSNNSGNKRGGKGKNKGKGKKGGKGNRK